MKPREALKLKYMKKKEMCENEKKGEKENKIRREETEVGIEEEKEKGDKREGVKIG